MILLEHLRFDLRDELLKTIQGSHSKNLNC
jgi:hypothetical protein